MERKKNTRLTPAADPDGGKAVAKGKPGRTGRPSSAGKARLSSVANAIRVTKAFTDDEYEMGISDLSKRLGLAKSTVHRHAATLVEAEFLEQNKETGKYRLGMVLFELGALVRRKMDVANEARPQLRSLMEMTGETVQLAIFDHLSVLYINKMESRQAVRMSSAVGSRAPAYCTSVGKVLLAHQPDEVIKRVVQAGLERFSPKTITTASVLAAELERVRAGGYAVDDEEMEVGLRCVAAPIRNHSGAVIAAIGVAAPIQRMNKKNMQTCTPMVVAAADTISRRLGYLPARTRLHRAV